jgi:hypothetical protein
VCVTECDQVQRQPSTPRVSRSSRTKKQLLSLLHTVAGLYIYVIFISRYVFNVFLLPLRVLPSGNEFLFNFCMKTNDKLPKKHFANAYNTVTFQELSSESRL